MSVKLLFLEVTTVGCGVSETVCFACLVWFVTAWFVRLYCRLGGLVQKVLCGGVVAAFSEDIVWYCCGL